MKSTLRNSVKEVYKKSNNNNNNNNYGFNKSLVNNNNENTSNNIVLNSNKNSNKNTNNNSNKNTNGNKSTLNHSDIVSKTKSTFNMTTILFILFVIWHFILGNRVYSFRIFDCSFD